MRPILRSILLTAVVVSTALFLALASAPNPAPAATLASKQAQARELDAQVRKLEQKYDVLQERYRGAQYELERIQRDVADAHRVVVATRRDLGVAKRRLALRVQAIYRTGGSGSELAELASAGSFTDFFDRIESVRRIGDQDATVLDRVEALNAQVERKERILRTAKRRAAAATRRAERDKDRMQDVLDARQAKLDSVNADIRAIMEAQRRAEEARARAEARRSAGKAQTGESPSSSGGSTGGGMSIPLPPGSGTAAAAANAAMGKLGAPYVWAAAGPDSFDCSGLVVWAFAQVGRSGLPHSTYSLINLGVEVPMDQLQVGDLVFSSSIGHVGIYVGGGSFVHAPHTGDVVKVTSLGEYSMTRARRI